jgi:hypothetical protein
MSSSSVSEEGAKKAQMTLSKALEGEKEVESEDSSSEEAPGTAIQIKKRGE